ncbi:ABC transporter substrate-binding protein [Thalassiella azotivora]
MQLTAWRRGTVLATSAALVLALAACGDGQEGTGGDSASGPVPGVTDTEVVVGTHMPLTGPASAGYSKIAPATKAYFDYVNDNGGVHGRQIRYEVKDDQYNPATTQQVVRELVLQEEVFALLNGLGTPTHTGVLDFVNSNEVPDLFVASGSRAWNDPSTYPYTFGYNTDYVVESKILATYAQEAHAGRTICSLGQDDDFGEDFEVGLEAVLGADGLADKQRYTVTNQDVAPQVNSLKASGCEVVMLATVPGFTALTIGTAARLGFQPQWMVSSVGGDYTTLSGTLGDAAPLLEGMVGMFYLPHPSDPSDPWTAKFMEINEEYNGGAEFDGNVVYGMSVGYNFVQALQRAGEDLTRERLVEVLEEGDFPGPGLVPVRWSADDHSGYSGQRLWRVEGGAQAYFGPAYVTDDGDAPVEEYTQERPEPGDLIPTE